MNRKKKDEIGSGGGGLGLVIASSLYLIGWPCRVERMG